MKSLSYLLSPDYYFEHFYDITPEFLSSKGISALLIDIDNTVAPYEISEPDERTKKWFDSLSASGIKAAFISNNHKKRVERFNREIGIPAFYDSGKPSTRTLKRAVAKMGVSLSCVACLGDQLITDALAAHRLGVPVIIVPPIKDKKNLFVKTKRLIERPYMRSFFKNLESEKSNDKD